LHTNAGNFAFETRGCTQTRDNLNVVISGAHVIIYSRDADADRAFLRDVLGLDSVDAGGGWLIFALPPAEVAVHPAGEPSQELYLMCDDVEATVDKLQRKGARIRLPITEQRWGRIVHVELPGGGKVGLYQPKHPLAPRR
jgi:predicted enzyme related to lactoylglutathione lyase